MVGSTTNRIAYNVTSASTAPLAVDFRFDDSGWLQLRYAETGAEESQLLVIGTHYTVAGDGTAIEGTVTLTSGFLDTITAGELVIARFTPAVQEVNLEYNTRFPAVAVENQMDETVMALQDRTDSNFQAGSRAIYLPPNEPSSNPNTLPLPSFRAGKFFAFDSTTGAIEALSTEDAAIRILRYYGLTITSEDVLATISAIAPLRRFTPPTTSTEGLFGQLAIIPSSTSVIMTPPGFDPVTLHEVSYEEFLSLTGNTPEFVPDSSYPFYAYLQDGYQYAHSIYPLESVPNWQATFYESPSSFASISASSDFPATPDLADWSMAPFAITVTAGPSVEARAWINVALTGMTPDWREIPSQEANDLRYGLEETLRVTTSQTVTNSSTLTDSTVLQSVLGVGVYEFETIELLGSSDYATAGAKSQLTFTGTGTFDGFRERGGSAATEPINVAPTWGGTGETVNGLAFVANSSLMVRRVGRLVVTAPGTLKVQFAQNTATPAHTASLLSGSFLKIRKTS